MKSIHISVGLGWATNNMAELSTVMMLVIFVLSIGVNSLQFVGDSQLITDLFIHKKSPKNTYLKPLYKSIQRLLHTFEDYSFKPIF